jgi:hypothetical protein
MRPEKPVYQTYKRAGQSASSTRGTKSRTGGSQICCISQVNGDRSAGFEPHFSRAAGVVEVGVSQEDQAQVPAAQTLNGFKNTLPGAWLAGVYQVETVLILNQVGLRQPGVYGVNCDTHLT